ncbi:MAG: prepilin-type N-terminal cleavage/methylation domain-containing protein [Actinomycetota bacterium]|nr:prepilin-type N-terminal cleavage/methylation domain-containing protein [Actinomycetota bacterium]
MLTRLNKTRDDSDRGFTLIELLVVVAIIGILAAIAIPVFLSQRNSARDASVKSDINGVAKVMETLYVENNAYPTTTVELTAGNPQSSPGNQVTVTITGGGTGYTITGCNTDADVMYTYSSTAGGLDPAGVATATCTTAGITVAP